MSKPAKVVILTDLHLRADYFPGFLDAQVETLLHLANRKPCSHVVINGDVFERRNPRSEELLAFGYLLDNIDCKNIIVNRGNHDTLRKDGTSDTILSLFSEKAHIVKDTVSNGAYAYEARVKRWHFKKKPFAFLGHIHKPKIYDNVVILGTAYSNTFGEANAQKFVHELVIRDQEIELIKKPIGRGIKHIVGTIDEIPELDKKHSFKDFYTILRVKMDKLDSYTEQRLKEEIFAAYPIQSLELVFEDVLPKFESGYIPKNRIFSLDDKVIDEYINASDSVFSKKELMAGLKEVKDAVK